MKRKLIICTVAVIVFISFNLTQGSPIEPVNFTQGSSIELVNQKSTTAASQNNTSKLQLTSKSSLLSLLSVISSLESKGERAANSSNLADAVKNNTNSTVDARNSTVLAILNSTTDIPSLNSPSTLNETSSAQAETLSSKRESQTTITLNTKKPVFLSSAEIRQIANIANNRRQANYRWEDNFNNDREAEAAIQMMVQRELGHQNKAEEPMQQMFGETADFRADTGSFNLLVDKIGDEGVVEAAMKMIARTMPQQPLRSNAFMDLNFNDTDEFQTLNDSVSESGSIWQTYETKEKSTTKTRKCFECQPEIHVSWRDPRLNWICGGYNRARRTFKSVCMMQMRNCQDGTMFVKLHDGKCPPDTMNEPMPHGKTFFYEYDAPLSFESRALLDSSDSLPIHEEQHELNLLYDKFKFIGREKEM